MEAQGSAVGGEDGALHLQEDFLKLGRTCWSQYSLHSLIGILESKKL